MRGRHVFLAIAFLFAGLHDANAQRDSRFLSLEHQISLAFQPEEIVMLIERGEGDNVVTSRARGGAVPLEPLENSRLRGGVTRYLVGTLIERGEAPERIRYSILLAGKGNRFEFVPMQEIPPGLSDPLLQLTPQESGGALPMYALRGAVLERRAKLEAMRRELDAVTVELERVGKSAQEVAGFDAILQARAERRKIESEVEGAIHYNANLARSVERSRTSPAPSNFARRELELTQQIAEIVRATTDRVEREGDPPSSSFELLLPALRQRFGGEPGGANPAPGGAAPTRSGSPGKRGSRLTARR